jgi:hypothetical protein
MEANLIASQEVVLQKIGRNLLRLQHMERKLKFLTAINGFEAPLSSFQAAFAARLKEIERMPLGQVVESVAKAVFAPDRPSVAKQANASQATVRFTFGLEDCGHLQKEWRRQQREIVRERNHLVHRFAAECDLRTIEGCEASAQILDQQRERIISAAESIDSMVSAVREAFADIQSGKASLTR